MSPQSDRKACPAPAVPRPSASIIVVNSQNEILLVHRNPKSKSFANAHVFPGGNYDEKQDGNQGLPFTAIRELFEETGLLLVHPSSSLPPDAELDTAREAIRTQKLLLRNFLSQHNLQLNVESLLPFTQWITPPGIPRRFHTQFYVAFLDETRAAGFSHGDKQERLPTPDGGQEVLAARFVRPERALAEFAARAISLFPPQFYLLTTLARILVPGERNTAEQRARVRALAFGAFGGMVINPRPLSGHDMKTAGYQVLTYEGDETRGGAPGRRHRSKVWFGPGGAAVGVELERNFDVFSEIERDVFTKPAKL
ncbi:hypothetical protein BD413DRAFT_600179 [Trametes elegans]|nr:hypothetical protein BD413DRAFT_600179 [Trametes elegans]